MSEREILFRGKRVDNGEWIEGGFVPSLNGKRFYIGNMFECEEIVPETFGQFTGLTDKNGTRIFEGDIVKVADEYIDYAIWANGCFCMARQMMFYEFTYQDSSRMEVIGNVHNNPELLKGD